MSASSWTPRGFLELELEVFFFAMSRDYGNSETRVRGDEREDEEGSGAQIGREIEKILSACTRRDVFN